MKNKKPNNLKAYGLVLLASATLMVVSIYFNYIIENKIPISIGSILDCLFALGASMLAVVVFAFICFTMYKIVDHKTVQTQIHLFGIKLSEKIRLKNTNTIYPPLLLFFYFVLERNNEFLKLPLGKDYSALIPNGYKTFFRQGSVFYIFQLVMPEKPVYDEKTLKQLIQSYVDSELINYGITGLNSCFKSRIHGLVPSVYVDRAYYNESQHMLNFAVIYACSEYDVNYVLKAKQRDMETMKIERSVYDDEVR